MDEDFQMIISQEDYKRLVSQKNLAQVSLSRSKEELKKLQQKADYQQSRRDKQIEFLSLLLRSYTESILSHKPIGEGQRQKSETHWYESIDLILQNNQDKALSLQKNQDKAFNETKNALAKKYLIQLNNMTKVKKSFSWQLQLISDQEQQIKALSIQLKTADTEHSTQIAKIIQRYQEQITQIQRQSKQILDSQKMLSRNLNSELQKKENVFNEKLKNQINAKDKEVEKVKQIAKKSNQQLNIFKVQNENLNKVLQKLRSQFIDIKKINIQTQTIHLPDFNKQITELKRVVTEREVLIKKLDNQNDQLQEKVKQVQKENQKMIIQSQKLIQQMQNLSMQVYQLKNENRAVSRKFQDQLCRVQKQKQILVHENKSLKQNIDQAKIQLSSQRMILKQQDQEIKALGRMIDEMALGDKIGSKGTEKSSELEKKKGIKNAINEYYHEIEQNLISMNALQKNDIVTLIDHQLQNIQMHVEKIMNQNKKRAK